MKVSLMTLVIASLFSGGQPIAISHDVEDSELELNQLRQEIDQLKRDNADLECLLETVITHSDAIEGQLYQLNQHLKSAIIDRQQAEVALQEVLQVLLQEKSDLEILLETSNVHGDTIEDILFEKLMTVTQQATTDALTTLANRRRFDQYLEQEWQALARSEQPLSLLLCDVDYFKYYNDTYGHQAGDQCLQAVAGAIRTTVHRPRDLVARYGGEEFALVLPETKLEGALIVAQAILAAVRQLKIAHTSSLIRDHVTLSIGVTCKIPTSGFTPTSMTLIADRALYQAKQQGRDRVISYLGI